VERKTMTAHNFFRKKMSSQNPNQETPALLNNDLGHIVTPIRRKTTAGLATPRKKRVSIVTPRDEKLYNVFDIPKKDYFPMMLTPVRQRRYEWKVLTKKKRYSDL
jgi:hypothetical protein